MGIKEKFQELIEFIADQLLRPIVEFFTELVNSLLAIFRWTKHEIAKAIAKWLENDLAFVVSACVLIVGAFLIPRLLQTKVFQSIKQIITEAVEYVKTAIAESIPPTLAISLTAANQIMKIIWPVYREMSSEFQNAVSAFASELGEGSGLIHAYFSASYSLNMLLVTTLNLPPEVGELAWFEQTEEMLSYVDEKFAAYARDPGLIWQDYIDNWIIPVAEQQQDIDQARWKVLVDTTERVRTIEELAHQLEIDVNTFIESMPDEIQKQFLLRWEPVKEWLDDKFEYIETEVLPRLDEIELTLQQAADRIEAVNAAALENALHPVEMALLAEETFLGYTSLMQDFYGLRSSEGIKTLNLPLVDEIGKYTTEAVQGIIEAQGIAPGMPEIEPTVQALPSAPYEAPVSNRDWFCGEY